MLKMILDASGGASTARRRPPDPPIASDPAAIVTDAWALFRGAMV
jgi:hypothetical protein